MTHAYQHAQVDCMPPRDNKEDFANAVARTTAFLERGCNHRTTFIYSGDTSSLMRICINVPGQTPYAVDVPMAAALRNANARTIEAACGLYTIAAHAGALNVFVMHNSPWGNSAWDPACSLGEPTPFRGVPIIDTSKIFGRIIEDPGRLCDEAVSGEGKKERVELDLGFKMSYAEDEDPDADDKPSDTEKFYPVMMEIALQPRRIKRTEGGPDVDDANVHTIACDMRLSPHGHVSLETALVGTFFLKMDHGTRKNIMNVNLNCARDVGAAVVSSGAKHKWSGALASAIDDDDDDDDDEGAGSGGDKRAKLAADAVA
jgi:hypothetical protein